MPPEPTTSSRPLLSIAIPTFHRSALLRELLTCLQGQHLDPNEVEIFVSDNASPDDTSDVVQHFLAAGNLPIRYHRHPTNIGSDANFAHCFHSSRGRYFWLCGDDDLLAPEAVSNLLHHLRARDFDIVYATSYGFRRDPIAERIGDPLGRRFHTLTDPRDVARVINIMLTFISGIIINKERLEHLPHEDPSAFIGTNLVQLSWSLPLLLQHRRSLILWERPVAGRQGNSGGYSIGEVFGRNLSDVTRRCLPGRPDLSFTITNFALRRWFPSALYEHRAGNPEAYRIAEAEASLRRTFGRNFRFWLFTWPVLRLPLPLANLWVRAGVVVSKLIYALSVPNFYRTET